MYKIKFLLLAGLPGFLILFTACGGGAHGGSGANNGSSGATISIQDQTLTLQQNDSASIDLAGGNAYSVQISQAPAKGKVVLSGTVATYQATDPLYSGSDSFRFRVSQGTSVSNEATVHVTLTPLGSGTSTFTENYAGKNFVLPNWQQFTSTFGQTAKSIASFSSDTYNGATVDTRHFGIYGDISSYAGDSFYKSLFSTLPVDGAGGTMRDWPWKADLIHIPECSVDVTVTLKIVANLNQAPMLGILLDYGITKDASGAYVLNGYQVLVNSGGGSLTLSRFINADEHATAYLDRWPNTTYGNENKTNPITSGPYKGWNYRNGVWPAGGNVGVRTAMYVAVRYQYDVTSGNTTVSYEARNLDGTDSTPNSWDVAVTLTGADSLPPGGGWGLMPMNYHTATQLNTTDFDIAEYKLNCVLP